MTIADLHIHSRYSRATSRDCVPEQLDFWARRKGIDLLGTGDFTHPAWREELREKLVPAGEGLYRLKEEAVLPDAPAGEKGGPQFVITGEISSIYKKNGRTRKVHSLILLPSLEAADALSHRLEAIGNIHSDGRPILGLDCRDLLEITLEACPEALFIPAHIWTPHFSLFGAFSGFDSIEECFEDLTPYIRALETGLSSDPAMNWQISALDGYTLVSNSDAHSPAKLGREANLLDIPLTYPDLKRAVETGEGFAGTIEFFPEEGKYHYDGHRGCGVCLEPAETDRLEGKCPVCGRKITVGVQHRVDQLSDREAGYRPKGAKDYESLVPLPEVIAACCGFSATSVKVRDRYEAMLRDLGNEFAILREISVTDIERAAGPAIAEGIRRLRAGKVSRSPGFDGEYGTIALLSPEERDIYSGQISLFGASGPAAPGGKRKRAGRNDAGKSGKTKGEETSQPPAGLLEGLNEEQLAAVTASDPAVAVIAGPGTGKTKTLVSRIAYLVQERGVKPSEITAVTFTNKAAAEMLERLEIQFGDKRKVGRMQIGTFHSLCLHLLDGDGAPVALLDESAAEDLAAQVLREEGLRLSPRKFLEEVSRRKAGVEDSLPAGALERYRELTAQAGALDFDDLLIQALEQKLPQKKAKAFSYLLVDEFQDVSPLQYELVRAWNAGGKSLFVIGDPDQSIYGFRGADARCFARLADDMPGLRTIHLKTNYRSTPPIISCALAAIAGEDGKERPLTPHRTDGAPVRLVTAESALAEGIFVAKEIGRMVGGVDMLEAQASSGRGEGGPVRSFDDIAVLYRTHHEARLLEKCLRQESIPYVVHGREDFLTDEKVRGTAAFFRALLRPGDGLSLQQSLSLLWNCPADLAQSAGAWWKEHGQGMEEGIDALLAAFENAGHLRQWGALTREFFPRCAKESPYKLLEDFRLACGLNDHPPLEKLTHMAVFDKKMTEFLDNLALGTEGDLRRAAQKSYQSGAVRLMTLHGAKGLEFPVVFLWGVNKGSLPLVSSRHPTDPAEERRLFYVGLTRAKEELIIMTSSEPSPFLAALPREHLQASMTHVRKAQEAKQMSLFD
ncbi:UvrD-helicase domain-containing protein [Zongyangia hominis]|uniref:DNA 3'-5' helicase n=1 Tax=Zongyangia hominis TaxID=2763677 RepID=A0A926IC17_9FIRM|nr:UvrD-helicase domain-containing protein [Zongyangia hominis]MBC8570873.1 UvrD-helicase domain-containing protein [Zongyangia hominis]